MTFFGDIKNQAVAYTLFTPQALTQTTTSSVVDMGTAAGVGTTGLMTVGAVSGTGGPGLTVKFQECDTTNGTFSDITGAATTLFTVFNRTKRYIQAVGTVVGTTSPSITASVVILEQKKQL